MKNNQKLAGILILMLLSLVLNKNVFAEAQEVI